MIACNGKGKYPAQNLESITNARHTKVAAEIPVFNKDSLQVADAEILVKSVYDTVCHKRIAKQTPLPGMMLN
ncbi:MAG: hypothetical protein ABIP28_05050 [Mucilaginibacter sp.]